MKLKRCWWLGLWCAGVLGAQERVAFNHPGLETDLGVGLWAWPMPMDWEGDGDLDLVVSCPDVPYNGIYLFENPGGGKMPVFKSPRRLGPGIGNVQVSYPGGSPSVLVGDRGKENAVREFTGFLGKGFDREIRHVLPPVDVGEGRVRANQWKKVDFDGDGVIDLVNGIGYWGDYGWDNAYDAAGKWTRGPLRGWVFLFRNSGSNEQPEYEAGLRLQADGADLEVYGMPSPNFADFDGDGDLDLICGEFLDGFTWFKNQGTRTAPSFKKGVYLTHGGKKLVMHVQMITPVAIDWDGDGDVDLVVGDEDGRVALVENTGKLTGGVPQFLPPSYFKQEAGDLKFGALATPFSVDWDGDGDEDLICGNTAGNIGFIANLDGGDPPKWAEPVLLEAEGEIIRVLAGANGSIQGPAEAKWGYTVLNVADWNHDGLLDLVVNDIWGKVTVFEGSGTKSAPSLMKAKPVEVEWDGKVPKPAWNWWEPEPRELVTQWRTSPCVVDWNRDGLLDLVMLDTEGYLALFTREKRDGRLILLPGRRVFRADGADPLRLTTGEAGKSGRRKLCFADWDRDGDLDLLANSVNVELFENLGGQDGMTNFRAKGMLGARKLAGHTTCPTSVDWNRDGIRDILLGAEDGRFYLLKNHGRATD